MQLVFASNNKNKIMELQSMLPENITIVSLESISCFEDIPETADNRREMQSKSKLCD
jgi:XTP/dITP diphosphohydrolase